MNAHLTELKKRFLPEAALAITLESGRLSAAFVSQENGGRELFSLPFGAELVAADPEKAGKELAAALSTAGVRQKRCVVCLPPGWALTASTDLPEMPEEDLRSFLELRAEREFPMAADEMRISHSPYSLPDGSRRTTLAAVPNRRMEAVEKMLAAAGCRAVSVSLALDECLAEPKPALHFLANGTHTSVVVTAGGGVVSMRSLASPGPVEGETPFDAAAFYREVRITLGRLPEPIRQQVREARFGGTPASAKRLSDATADQLLQLGLESVNMNNGANGSDAPREAAVAAAQCFLRKQPVTFEFVVPEVKQWEVMLKRADLKGRKRLIQIVAAAILLPLVMLLVRGQIEGYYARRWARMENTVNELSSLQKKIMMFHPWFKGAPVTVQTIDGLASVFPEQGDVWAKNLVIKDNGQVTLTAFARSRAAELAFNDRLISHPGVTKVGTEGERGTNPIEFTVSFTYNPIQ